ncbi:MAG TPA: hypothetical protein VM692_14840, partial [Gammaproteobacteria bacterium]|nr:hypothetical protein [Gammaproteobacteria bacterium]
MNTDSLFKQLDAPPGGAERFARRLGDATAAPAVAPRWVQFALAGATAAAAALVVAVVLSRAPD